MILISSSQMFKEYGAIILTVKRMSEETSTWDYISVVVVEEYNQICETCNAMMRKAEEEENMLAGPQRDRKWVDIKYNDANRK